MEPEPPPCEVPAWPHPPALGGVPEEVGGKLTGRVFLTPDGIAEVGRYVALTTAYYDAVQRCRKAAQQ